MNTAPQVSHTKGNIHLSFSQDRLATLIREGKLHAADFNCLDRLSKRTVWTLLLTAAARKLS